MPSPHPGRRSARSAVAALLLLSAVAYTAWVLAELLATGWSLAAIAAFEAGHGTWSLGAGQRLQVLLVALWLALLALAVARPDGAAATQSGAPAGARAEGGRREPV
ncbi:hypothetical protein ACIGZJ_32265 [Kitasatospora sp. NPDC052868]|uniref:hypothetical protein n=1 Tax=Kitasatospora sp. NPDC052868 TaxID=3364060 RepID=UPI0037C7F59A